MIMPSISLYYNDYLLELSNEIKNIKAREMLDHKFKYIVEENKNEFIFCIDDEDSP